MPYFRRKPVAVVEAVQWNADIEPELGYLCKDHPSVRGTSYMEVANLLGTRGRSTEPPYWSWSVMGVIETLGWKHVVCPGDWIIKRLNGEFYPCKPDIFEKTYEPVAIEPERID